MDWSLSTWWWIASGALVAAELATGTFYLLMLALGAAAGAIAAHFGLGFTAQMLSAAVVGGGAVAAWHLKRGGTRPAVHASENRDVNLDIGEHVDVVEWDADGTASAQYRGARWSVRHAGSGTPRPGRHVIRRVEGNRLHVERAD
ncbi:MAG: NfeD family protein [Aquincola sp.]|nr:NfeD family protein [Aquincola sp.]MDH4290661.1 NfeD family protein [Aquincola sp.]MDH5329100.1 NfeD family protein [Aquincola sp.]